VESVNGNPDTWKIYNSSNYSYSQPNAAGIYSPRETTLNDWLFTPEIASEENGYYKLSFRLITRVDAGSKENLSVYLGSGQSVDEMEATALLEFEQINNTVYQKQEVIFTAPSSENFVIGFHAYSENGYFLYIDDVEIIKLADYDAAITDIISPAETVAAGSYGITATLFNAGGETLTSMDIDYKVDSETNTFTWIGDLAAGESINVTIATDVDFSENSSYNVVVTAKQDGDGDSSNDSFSKDINVYDAYSIPFVEDFNNVIVPALAEHWIIENLNNDNKVWITNGASNDNTLYIEGTRKDDWLFTPAIALQANKKYMLNLKSRARLGNNPEKLKVQIGNLASSSAMDGEVLVDLGAISNTTFEETEKVFSVTADGNYVLGLYAYSTSGYILYVDDISVTEVPDIGFTEIINPTGEIEPGTNTPIEATLKNNSSTITVTSAKVSYTINNGSPVINDWTGSLAPGETATVTFDPIDFDTEGEFTIEACSELPNGIIDARAQNDCVSTTVIVSENQQTVFPVPFEEKFDGVTVPALPESWGTENTKGGGSTWITTGLNGYIYSAPNAATIANDITYGMDDWLFTPFISMEAGVNYQLGFYYGSRGDASVERLTVCIGTSAGSADMTTELIDLEEFQQNVYNPAPGEPANYAYAEQIFTVPEDGNYVIGFHGHSDPATSWMIFLDDISVILSPLSAMDNNNLSVVTAYPNPFIEEIIINDPEGTTERVHLTNISGQRVIDTGLNGKNSIYAGNLPSGIYFITMIDRDGKQTVQKMIKK